MNSISGTTHWKSPNRFASNTTGFTAFPSGFRLENGDFDNIGSDGYRWSFSENKATGANVKNMYYSNSAVSNNYSPSIDGYSVRCIKDFY